MKAWLNNGKIKADREITTEEQELLKTLMEWAGLSFIGNIHNERWNDYVQNKNGPRYKTDDGSNRLVFDTDGNWTADWWECLFDDYGK